MEYKCKIERQIASLRNEIDKFLAHWLLKERGK